MIYFISYHITTNISKYDNEFDINWIISLTSNLFLASEYIPIFERDNQIKSYQTYIYASLVYILFISIFTVYLIVSILNEIIIMCGNESYV